MLNRREFTLGALGLPALSLASPGLPSPGTDETPLARRYRFKTEGSDIETGGALIAVDGTVADVLRVVQRYGRYVEILPRLEKSRIVGKKKGHSDVYLRAPILNGLMHVWGVARFTPPRSWRNGKRIDGKMVKGNFDHWSASWKLRPCNGKVILRMEMLVDLEVPVPRAWITPELEWACDRGVTAVKKVVENG